MLQLRTPRAAYRTNGRLSRLTTTPTRSTSSRFGGSGRIGVVGRTQRRVRILVPVQVTEARTTRPTRSADGAFAAGLGRSRDARNDEWHAAAETSTWCSPTFEFRFPFGGSLPLFPACTHADCRRNYEMEESSGEAGRAPNRRSRPAPDASPWGAGPWRHIWRHRGGRERQKRGERGPPSAVSCRSSGDHAKREKVPNRT